MKNLLLSLSLLLSLTALSQEKGIETEIANASFQTVPETDNTIYNTPELRPEFPGGITAFLQFVSTRFVTPATTEAINGNLLVTFVIEKDGTLTDIKVLRDLGFGTGQEAVRVLQQSPKWKAGIQNGRPVRTRFSLPIRIVTTPDTPAETGK
ncbi:MAG: hypothetical protein CFE23_05935 [Flavobacterium sp. BFFFF1]|uniref:energy transducer TonB n=1 Tax=Flavobacterium sp. BFFFF1 TaxID=2015557 RepID=UPI000BC45FE1|nr:energy transducer TonB [Flavobacterium sp. BFFFF1]OYU81032.1 MAG: hypothetical protein CFE23_05935 [Flavobacterium sp. BFFFF1]